MNRLVSALSTAAESIMDQAEKEFQVLINDIDLLSSDKF